MKRVVPECPEDEPKSSLKLDEYNLKLITPLFGGGAVAGLNDMEMPIRATAVRGQLQFWWRATRGALFLTLAAMRDRHREVWGATDKASPVIVEVVDVRTSQPVPCARYEQGNPRVTWSPPFAGRDNALPYVLFPFQGKNVGPAHERKDPARCIHQASFTLRLRYKEDLRADVEAAVWAWVNFGGLGARTRRGCGALYCDRLAPVSVAKLEEWFKKNVVTSPTLREWPTMAGSILVNPNPGEPGPVWDWTVGLFRHFRQGEGFARNKRDKGNRPGRSFYPEPDTIRRIRDTWSAPHEPRERTPDGFPRAEFGLPIVFHFKDEQVGEPGQTVLYPFVEGETKERMATPVILKPLALMGGQTAIPVILILNTLGVSRVELQVNDGTCLTNMHAVPVRDTKFNSYPNSPLARSPKGSTLEAFVDFARSENFREIKA